LQDILRGDRLKAPSSSTAEYTSSIDADKILITHVVKINKAHMVMLAEHGIVNHREAALCLKALDSLPESLRLDPKLEDVHMNIEKLVNDRVGRDVGGRLHTAKSRNDQVATAIRLALREHLTDIINSMLELRSALLNRCEENLKTLMPGYTHLQHAQPITLAHNLLAHHDALSRDTDRLFQALLRVNQSPMGAAALATTTFKIDREMVAELLGFQGLVENSIDAVSARDFAIEVISDLALTMTDLSRLAEELILWSSREFGVVEMPDEYASTSSIMPQKKNPVVAEMVRAKTSHVYGDLLASLAIVKALPYSYNLDLQELTPHLWGACRVAQSSTQMMAGLIKEVKFNTKRLRELVKGDMSTATDLADTLVRELGIPFRLAHQAVGAIVTKAISQGKTLEQISGDEVGEVLRETLGRDYLIPETLLATALSPMRSIISREIIGGPAPTQVRRMVRARKQRLQADLKSLGSVLTRLSKAEASLNEAAHRIAGGVKFEG